MRLIDADALKEFIDDGRICDICPQKKPRCGYNCDFPDCVTEKWNVAIDAQPTIDAVEYARWLEKLIVDSEMFEDICENTPCPEWCEENCHYSSIQVDCLRHLFKASKGGDVDEIN